MMVGGRRGYARRWSLSFFNGYVRNRTDKTRFPRPDQIGHLILNMVAESSQRDA